MGSQCRYAGFACSLSEFVCIIACLQVMLPPTLGDSSNMFILLVNQLKVSSSPGVLNPSAAAGGLPSMVFAGAHAAVGWMLGTKSLCACCRPWCSTRNTFEQACDHGILCSNSRGRGRIDRAFCFRTACAIVIWPAWPLTSCELWRAIKLDGKMCCPRSNAG